MIEKAVNKTLSKDEFGFRENSGVRKDNTCNTSIECNHDNTFVIFCTYRKCLFVNSLFRYIQIKI